QAAALSHRHCWLLLLGTERSLVRTNGAGRTGNRPPERSICFLLLPNKKWAFRVPMNDQSLAVHERRQSNLSQRLEAELGEITFLMPSENKTENFFSQPAIQHPQLSHVRHMLQVVVDNGHVAHAFFDGFRGNRCQRSCPLPRVSDPLPRSPFATEGKAEQILDLPPLVARERHLT